MSLQKKSRRDKFQALKDLPKVKDQRLPPRTSKKPKKNKVCVEKKIAELSRTDLPSSKKTTSVGKNASPRPSLSIERSNQSDSLRSVSPGNLPEVRSAFAKTEDCRKDQATEILPCFEMEDKVEEPPAAIEESAPATPIKLPAVEIKVERVCLGEILKAKVEAPIAKDSVKMPHEFTPYKESENFQYGSRSEVDNLFESIHRNLFPKFRAPTEARDLLETKATVPLCYQNLLNAFINIELALFYLIAQSERLTYKKLKDRIFSQTRR